MTRTFNEFLIEDFKTSEEALAFFKIAIEDFLQNNDLKTFNTALNLLIKAQGSVTNFSKTTGVSRTHLYKILKSKSEPKFSTLKIILNQLGFEFKISPIKRVA